MRILEKIKLNLINGKSRIILFFGIPLVQYDTIYKNGKKNKKYYLPLFRKYKSYSNNPNNAKENVFYLKVNLEYNYAFVAIQHWINIVNEMDADFYFVCDKKDLLKSILQRIRFKNSNIKFIKSIRHPLKRVIKNLTTPNWENAGYAHLTTFYHAKKLGLNHFWNIDADDTSLVAEPKKIVQILKSIQEDARKRDISITSLDMWRSRSWGKQWTFGISYTRNIDKFIEIFNNAKKTWQDKYKNCDNGLNVDWFITYLMDNKFLNIETWYVENMYFIHWCRDGNFISNVLGSYLCYWKQGKIVFQNEKLGELQISTDCKKYDFNISEEDSLLALQNRISYLPHTRPVLKKLWHVELKERKCSQK